MLRGRIITFYENCFSWFALWYLLYGKSDQFTGVILFIGLSSFPAFLIRLTTGHRGVKFNTIERYALFSVLAMLVAFSTYMILCLYSVPQWIYNHNTKMGTFIAITTIINLITTYKLSRENK